MKKLAILSCFLLLQVSVFAGGFLKLAPVGVVNFSNPKVNVPLNPVSTSGTLKIGFGGLAYIPVFPFFCLESGLLYAPETHTENSTTSISQVNTQNLIVPLMLRFEPLSFISLGLGGYLGFGMGNVSVSTNNVPTDYSYEAYFLSNTDFGLAISGALQIPILPLTDILIDARFLLGLKNRDTTIGNTNRSYNRSNLLILAGLRFGF